MPTFRPSQILYAKFLGCGLLVCCLFVGNHGIAQPTPACVLATATAEVGTVEATGRNDGPRIFEYLRAGGMKDPAKVKPKYRSWCGGFVSWVLHQCGYDVFSKIKNPLATASWVTAKGIVPKSDGTPEAGDVLFYNFSGRRVGADHTEFCREWHPNPRFPFCVAIGGNTSDPTRQSGDGVYIKASRLKRQVTFYYPLSKL